MLKREGIQGVRQGDIEGGDAIAGIMGAQADRNAVCLPMTAGSAILFNDRCIHSSTPNLSNHVRWSVDLRYQPTEQMRMREYGIGFLARSRKYPERVARVDDWMAGNDEHAG